MINWAWRRQVPNIVVIVLVLLGALAGEIYGIYAHRPVRQPEIKVWASTESQAYPPKAMAWYQDGAWEEFPVNIPFHPTRPLNMVMVWSTAYCLITVDEGIVDERHALGGNVTCDWVAPK